MWEEEQLTEGFDTSAPCPREGLQAQWVRASSARTRSQFNPQQPLQGRQRATCEEPLPQDRTGISREGSFLGAKSMAEASSLCGVPPVAAISGPHAGVLLPICQQAAKEWPSQPPAQVCHWPQSPQRLLAPASRQHRSGPEAGGYCRLCSSQERCPSQARQQPHGGRAERQRNVPVSSELAVGQDHAWQAETPEDKQMLTISQAFA